MADTAAPGVLLGRRGLLRRLDALVAQVAAAKPVHRIAVLGDEAEQVADLLAGRAPAVAVGEPVGVADLVVAVGVLPAAEDPVAVLRGWVAAAGDVVVAVPRQPLHDLTAEVAGLSVPPRLARWTTPAFLRLASQAGALREQALPWPWTVVWVRANTP